MRDVALLLGCFVKLRRFVVRQAPPENFKNFRRGFAGGTDNENAIELMLVRAIAFRKRKFYVFASGSNCTLLFARPGSRLRRSSGRRVRIANPRVTAKRFQPIGFRETLPDLIANGKQSSFIENWSVSCHFARPGL